MMAARHYFARTEDGYHVDDPSHVALVVLINELNHVDNTFITIQPAIGDPGWHASVSLREDDTYEVVCRDDLRQDHRISSLTDPGRVADDLSSWLAGCVADTTP
ncbi:hypothetical protein ACFHYQ_14395 [Sphaerimonospora cavernae]|uniref:Uncharacterized protein n=1 Tax=Sphaerimonospora cavernae TaxID=1740611 RepID=A0ABV6U4X0_9ACTN